MVAAMSMTLRLLVALGLAAAAPACTKSATDGGGQPAAPGTAQGGGGGVKPVDHSNARSLGTGEDPEKGEFTLDEATAGLAAGGALGAEIVTDMGTITCALLPDRAPATVASFVGLARGVRPWRDPQTGEWWLGKPYFDGLAFHRVIPEFMIQGGDSITREYEAPGAGSGGPGFTLPDELDPAPVFDEPGLLAMANRGPRTHSGGSQFFVTEVPRHNLDGGYVIFGRCEGIDVVKQIARVPVGGANKPLAPVTMKVRILRR